VSGDIADECLQAAMSDLEFHRLAAQRTLRTLATHMGNAGFALATEGVMQASPGKLPRLCYCGARLRKGGPHCLPGGVMPQLPKGGGGSVVAGSAEDGLHNYQHAEAQWPLGHQHAEAQLPYGHPFAEGWFVCQALVIQLQYGTPTRRSTVAIWSPLR
jgi:hypothetical protein